MEVGVCRNCILVVEDEPSDVLLLEHAFRRADISSPIKIVEDGQAAIDYLAGVGPFADRKLHPLPNLILLDLKLPRRSGLDVLQWIRQQPALKGLVVIILTSSPYPQDLKRAYELGANSFVVKPLDVNRRLQFAQLLKGWWLGFNEFPSMFQVHWAGESAA